MQDNIEGKKISEPPYAVTLDDDPVVSSLLNNILGMKTFAFSSSDELRAHLNELNPVGVFVDVHLEKDECGLDVIPELRRTWPSVPIIVITGDNDELLISQALAAGAHDFVVKPLRPVEITSRLNARREELMSRNEVMLVHYGDLVVDLQHKTLKGTKGQCFQSSREMEILTYLIHSSGSVVPKNLIKRHVWGNISVSNNALDRKLFEVRKSIRQVSSQVEMKSIYGQGIKLRLFSDVENEILLDDKELQMQPSLPKQPLQGPSSTKQC